MTGNRRAALIALAGIVAGAALASPIVEASTGSRKAGASTSTGGTSTATVQRTNLVSTVQVGGSIGYSGSYTVDAPSGESPQQIAQAQQAVSTDEANVAADQTALSADAASGHAAVSQAQTATDAADSTLTADESSESRACAGRGASSPACAQAQQKVSQDQTQVTQADQQLSSAQANLTKSVDQDQAKLNGDSTQLLGAEATLALSESSALNPGTTYTFLPQVGQVISRDQAVYALNGEPVPLLYGPMAAYRAMQFGMSDGPDVGELTRNLIALGFGAGLTQSDHFSAGTADAVESWQASLGLPRTGSILLGEVVFEPGAIRVTSVTPSIGQAVAPGAILDATSTNRVVTVALSVTQEYLVKPGDPVGVVLPDGTTTVPGHVETVSDVATCPGGSGTGSGTGSGNSGSGSAETPTCSGSNGSSTSPTVNVTITLDDPSSTGTLDEAPVNVDITSEQVHDVLAVPIQALLALEEGGYGVEVVSGGSTHLVGVQTGLFSNTLVEISGPGVSAGTVVEVPGS